VIIGQLGHRTGSWIVDFPKHQSILFLLHLSRVVMHGMKSLGTREKTERWSIPGDWVYLYGITLVLAEVQTRCSMPSLGNISLGDWNVAAGNV
jgi:hypothetical protein